MNTKEKKKTKAKTNKIGRPKKDKTKDIYSFRIDNDVMNKLKLLAKLQKTTASQLVEKSINKLLRSINI